jgi:hypothetical protein
LKDVSCLAYADAVLIPRNELDDELLPAGVTRVTLPGPAVVKQESAFASVSKEDIESYSCNSRSSLDPMEHATETPVSAKSSGKHV